MKPSTAKLTELIVKYLYDASYNQVHAHSIRALIKTAFFEAGYSEADFQESLKELKGVHA